MCAFAIYSGRSFSLTKLCIVLLMIYAVGGCWVDIQFGVKNCVIELPFCFSQVVFGIDDDYSFFFFFFFLSAFVIIMLSLFIRWFIYYVECL